MSETDRIRQASIVEWLEAAAAASLSRDDLFQQTADRIRADLAAYDWVGFYMLDPEDATMLLLGPFAGAPTPHVRIPIAEGICGAAVALGETIVVDDVLADPRYLSCSLETKSEIVVPIRAHGSIAGEIDIDSHAAAAFGKEDRIFVERCAAAIGRYLEGDGHSK